MTRSLSLAVCLGLVLAGHAPAPDPRFGAVQSYQAPDLAAGAGVGWDRLIVHWSVRQPDDPGQWIVPGEESAALDRAQAAGREVVILLMGTPAWATDARPEIGVPRGLSLPIDDPGNAWAAFVRHVVGDYRGRVHHWVIWNEPDIAAPDYGVQFDGGVADYYQLLKTAYLAAREADPQAIIHLAGLTYWHDIVHRRPAYLQRLLDAAARDPGAVKNHYYFDVFTAHIYFRTETVPEIVSFYRRVLRRYGLRAPIWINETNAAPMDDPLYPASPLVQVTMDEQASFIIQANALALALGVERIAVYKLIDDVPGGPSAGEPYGLYRADGSARPAAAAFRTVTGLFAHTESAAYLASAGYYLVTMKRAGAVTRVVWARGRWAVKIDLRATTGATGARLYDRSGNAAPIAPVRGYYKLQLPAANCSGQYGCAVGGAPWILVEGLPPPQ